MEAEKVEFNRKKLRCGITTGTCAAAAAKGAALFLFTEKPVQEVSVSTPKGHFITVKIESCFQEKGWSHCVVKKDSGDDPDVTNGVLVYASIRKNSKTFRIDGGKGIGTVTKEGLDQPVGAAAINHVPRQMITENVMEVCKEFSYFQGMDIIISIPEGVELAKKTFNPRLGIIGGLSILGTTGILKPMSEEALFDSIVVEMKMHIANGAQSILLTPGNYGETFVQEALKVSTEHIVRISNFVGKSLEAAQELGFKEILLVGHLGKFVKLAGGILQTHSKYGDCRMELLGVHGAMVGADCKTVQKLMECVTTESALEVLEEAKLKKETLHSLLIAIEKYLHAIAEKVEIGIIIYSEKYGLLIQTKNANTLLKHFL